MRAALHTTLPMLERAWPKISSVLTVPASRSAYIRLAKILDKLIDEIGENESHPLTGLMETIGILIKEYEDEYYPMQRASAREVLAYLMKEHQLSQKDLKEVGSQGVISEILTGKRSLNIRQIRALGKRFHLPASVFI